MPLLQYGQGGSLTAAYDPVTGHTYSIQWYKEDTKIEGATTATNQIPANLNAGIPVTEVAAATHAGIAFWAKWEYITSATYYDIILEDTPWGRVELSHTSATTFSPQTTTARTMIVTILWRLEGEPAATGNGFEDVEENRYYTHLYRYAWYKDMDVSIGADTNVVSYTDAVAVSEYAVEAMQWACGAGIVQGSGGRLTPQGNATRAQVATMLMRLCEQLEM